ncbi:MAG: serine hydrolase [Mycobacteriaceae bacterium]
MRHRSLGALLGSLVLVVAVAFAPAAAAQSVTPSPPFTTPDTSSCPYREAPPPARDASEVPAPGVRAPARLSRPAVPVGGAQLGRCGVVVPVGAPAVPGGISAASWVLADLDSGEVLAAKDPHGLYRPASTLKVLTSLLVLRTLPLDRVLVGTQADAEAEGSAVGVGPGGRYTVKTLMTGLLLQSGNDAAHALAVAMGGVDTTVAAMNTLATSLGAQDTRAATPSGLDGPGQSTSAYDLALLFRAALAKPAFAALVSTTRATFPGYGTRPAFVIANDDQLLYSYPGALGGKPGFTDDARQTFVGAAERGGRRLVVALMDGERTPLIPVAQAGALLSWGFALNDGVAPVGRLVTGPPSVASPSTAATPTPAATPTQSPAPVVLAQAHVVSTGRSAAGMLGLAALVLAAALTVVLVALVVVTALDSRRYRRR